MTSRTKPPVKLPKGRVLYAKYNSFSKLTRMPPKICFSDTGWLEDDFPVALIPCRTRQEAREIVRLRRESRANLHARIMAALESEINEGDGLVHRSRQASAVINHLHLIP